VVKGPRSITCASHVDTCQVLCIGARAFQNLYKYTYQEIASQLFPVQITEGFIWFIDIYIVSMDGRLYTWSNECVRQASMLVIFSCTTCAHVIALTSGKSEFSILQTAYFLLTDCGILFLAH